MTRARWRGTVELLATLAALVFALVCAVGAPTGLTGLAAQRPHTATTSFTNYDGLRHLSSARVNGGRFLDGHATASSGVESPGVGAGVQAVSVAANDGVSHCESDR
jgi:hypothetical protein